MALKFRVPSPRPTSKRTKKKSERISGNVSEKSTTYTRSQSLSNQTEVGAWETRLEHNHQQRHNHCAACAPYIPGSVLVPLGGVRLAAGPRVLIGARHRLFEVQRTKRQVNTSDTRVGTMRAETEVELTFLLVDLSANTVRLRQHKTDLRI